MAQTRKAKREAIESLLPLLEAYLEYADLAAKVRRYGEAEGEEEHPPGWKPPPDYSHCDARCELCRAYQGTTGKKLPCPPEEKWWREWDKMLRDYPILIELEQLVRDLAYHHAHWASALYWHYVQPWDAFEPAKRAAWAAEAVAWLADRLPGEIPSYQPEYPARKYTPRDRRIIGLYVAGQSWSAICVRLGCSKTTVQAVLHGLPVRDGRTRRRKGR